MQKSTTVKKNQSTYEEFSNDLKTQVRFSFDMGNFFHKK